MGQTEDIQDVSISVFTYFLSLLHVSTTAPESFNYTISLILWVFLATNLAPFLSILKALEINFNKQ